MGSKFGRRQQKNKIFLKENHKRRRNNA